MKIYISHSGNFDYENELYSPLKSSSLLNAHRIFFPHDPENIDTNSRDIIAARDIVLAEVSQPSTGQGIELGWASANSTLITCIYKSGTKPSNSLRFVTDELHEYKDAADMVRQLEALLPYEHAPDN